MVGYGISKEVDLPFEQAVGKVREALSENGFGVLTEIDAKATLKKKLDVEFEDYLILGACNPPFAYKALSTEREVGLLMPCNVIIYRDGDATRVSAIRPTVAWGMVESPGLADVTAEVEAKLRKVVESV